jgi:hypothetical protein
MVTMVRRLFWLTLLAGAGFAGWALWSSSRQDRALAAPAGPATRGPGREPVVPAPTVTEAAPPAAAGSATTAPGATWVEPVDGACPDGYPIKANDNSGIYHAPGGRFYERTRPERCYPTAEAAEADGYRRSKS